MTKQSAKVTEKKEKTPNSGDEQSVDQEKEIGGFKDSNLLEPTRYGDWEVRGRCSDF
jgi:hypothetical protein